ncbi:phage tail component protein [Clostridiales bacterium oral taxon 876 str. F0540]|nr:phage tail component protein [Clostridiales bacterium oral taxon 876 str. F0540]
MDSFIWKGQDSWLDYGIVVNERPPFVKAEKQTEEIPVLGRDGSLTVDYESYKNINLPMKCTLLDNKNIDNVKAWLDGYGDLIFSWIPNKKYIGKMVQQIDIEASLEKEGEFPLNWRCQPFLYLLDNSIITLTQPSSIFNQGTYTSQPIFTIYGQGNITLTVNSKSIYLTDVQDYIIVDGVSGDCKEVKLCNSKINGKPPAFMLGENIITWQGNVTKIDIQPNWRCL